MHIIIIGCGKVGSKFATVLSEEGHDVVIVDSDRNSFKSLGADFNGITVTGVPIDQDVLKQAGIENADALAAVTPDDNINIMTCQVAREIFKVPKVIARIYNPAREFVFHQFGLDTICPTNLTVDVIRSMVLNGQAVSTLSFGNSSVLFTNKTIKNGYVGKKLSEIDAGENAMVFGVIKNGKLVLAKPDIRLEKDDVLVIAEKQAIT